MEIKNKKVIRGLLSFITMMMVVVMCFTLTVYAETDETEEKKIVDSVFSSDQADPEEVSEETPPPITKEDMVAAWDQLLNALDASQAAVYKQEIENFKWQTTLNRNDLHEEIMVCIRCLEADRDLEDRVAKITDRINGCAVEELTANQKALYLERLNGLRTEMEMDALVVLITDAKALVVDEAAEIHTSQLNGFLESVKALNKTIDRLGDLLENLPLLPALKREIESLTRQFTEGAETAGTGESALLEQIRSFSPRFKTIQENIDNFFDLTEEERIMLGPEISTLNLEVQNFTAEVLINAVRRNDEMEKNLAVLSQEAERIGALQMVVYVALGIAALSLIMGAVAAIMSVSKVRDNAVDLSVFATREDAETLNDQNTKLKQQWDLQEKKLDQMRQDLEHLAQKRQEIRPANPEPKPEPKPEPDPAPVVMQVLGSQKEVSRLKMMYQPMNPQSSYLEVHPNGAYVLYSDNTVEMSQNAMAMSNNFKGWNSNGMLLVFDAKVDGKMLDIERDAMPKGYYCAEKILRRASVVSIEQNRYAVQSRGIVQMQNE